MIGKRLDITFEIPVEKLAAIDQDNDTEDQHRIALLDCWEKREGKNTSCLKLAKVLHHRERRDLMELLCEAIRSSLSVSSKQIMLDSGKLLQSCASGQVDTAKKIDRLQKQFRDLHQRFLSELKQKKVSVEDVLEKATLLVPIEYKEYERSVQQMLPVLEENTRLTTLFNRLNSLFTFIDYGLLHHLISILGSKVLNVDMELYIDTVHEFIHETTVGNIIDYWPGDEISCESYSKLKAKLKDDPKTYTLEQLNNFRRKFCSKVRLSEIICGLVSLEPAKSFFVTWLIPTVVVPELKRSISQIDHHFCESEHIVIISIDQEQLYPLPLANVTLPLIPRLSAEHVQKQAEESLAGDLIAPTLNPKNTTVKRGIQAELSTDDTLNIIVIGWWDAPRFAKGMIGPNIDNSLKL